MIPKNTVENSPKVTKKMAKHMGLAGFLMLL